MTEPLFLRDAYQKEADALVLAHEPQGVVLDRSLFYATGGGQPGDTGRLTWETGEFVVSDTVKGDANTIVLQGQGNAVAPPVGTRVTQQINWSRRLGHMRVHTALHLLSVIIPLPVTGGSISAAKGRLDFNMPEAPEDKDALNYALNALISRDLPVSEDWITDTELDANPALVKTMSVQPPRGSGRVRLVGIGEGEDRIDLQPCGGTHVSSTGQIGKVRLGKIEKKGRQNRRVYLHLEAPEAE